MIFSKDFDLFSAIQKVRLSEKTSEILGQVSEKMKLESLAGLLQTMYAFNLKDFSIVHLFVIITETSFCFAHSAQINTISDIYLMFYDANPGVL